MNLSTKFWTFLSHYICKNSLLFLLLILVFNSIRAQESPPISWEGEALFELQNQLNCGLPDIETHFVIHYANETVFFIQFNEPPSNATLYTEDGSVNIPINEEASLSGPGHCYLIRDIQDNQVFQLEMENSCNEIVDVISISTTKLPLNQGFEVSDALYKTIVNYQLISQDEVQVQFCEYLYARNDIHFFEKVYFVQNHYFKGKDVGDFSSTILPICPITGNNECRCSFVLNNSSTLSPSRGISQYNTQDGSINPVVAAGASVKSNIGSNSDATTWSIASNVGAAKYHQLWTQGTCAGGINNTVSSGNETQDSPQFSSLTYNYFCDGGTSELPEECLCEKEIIFDYRYESEALADADRRSNCVGGKSAVAAAEDVVLVGYTIGFEEFEPVNAMSVRSESECDRSVNTEFWQNASDVIFDAAEIVVPILLSDATAAATLIQGLDLDDLSMSVNTLIGTPYYEVNECDEASSPNSVWGTETLSLEANKPISFFIFSSSRLMSGGRRSWFSTARILSNFNLTAYVPSDIYAEEICCTEKQTRWLWATYPGAPNPSPNANIGTFLGNFAPWNLPTAPNGAVYVSDQFGTDTYDNDICPNQTGDGLVEGKSDVDYRSIVSPIRASEYLLYDISGRLITKATEKYGSRESLIQHLKKYIEVDGVYILKIADGQQITTEKIFLTN